MGEKKARKRASRKAGRFILGSLGGIRRCGILRCRACRRSRGNSRAMIAFFCSVSCKDCDYVYIDKYHNPHRTLIKAGRFILGSLGGIDDVRECVGSARGNSRAMIAWFTQYPVSTVTMLILDKCYNPHRTLIKAGRFILRSLGGIRRCERACQVEARQLKGNDCVFCSVSCKDCDYVYIGQMPQSPSDS
ncbi:hypothetical protein ACOME3_004907 [Neoechinorhynchus agilis]